MSEETFKVTDRRRRLDEDPAPSRVPLGPEPPAPPPGVGAGAAAPETGEGGADLQGLLVMFATSALIGLGAEPDPMTGERRFDLERAQEAIETLLLLRVKTEGNRTAAESQLLEDILYDLQMRFVQAAQGDPGLR